MAALKLRQAEELAKGRSTKYDAYTKTPDEALTQSPIDLAEI